MFISLELDQCIRQAMLIHRCMQCTWHQRCCDVSTPCFAVMFMRSTYQHTQCMCWFVRVCFLQYCILINCIRHVSWIWVFEVGWWFDQAPNPLIVPMLCQQQAGFENGQGFNSVWCYSMLTCFPTSTKHQWISKQIKISFWHVELPSMKSPGKYPRPSNILKCRSIPCIYN